MNRPRNLLAADLLVVGLAAPEMDRGKLIDSNHIPPVELARAVRQAKGHLDNNPDESPEAKALWEKLFTVVQPRLARPDTPDQEFPFKTPDQAEAIKETILFYMEGAVEDLKESVVTKAVQLDEKLLEELEDVLDRLSQELHKPACLEQYELFEAWALLNPEPACKEILSGEIPVKFLKGYNRFKGLQVEDAGAQPAMLDKFVLEAITDKIARKKK